jgi:hypothetical protein
MLFPNEEDSRWNVMKGYILNNFWMQLEKEHALEIRSQLETLVNIAVHPNGTYFGLVRKKYPM